MSGEEGDPRARQPSARGNQLSGREVDDEYLNHLAHELRASLNTILGWAELLRTKSFDEAGNVRAAETIVRHARRQIWLINDLMDTWRLLSGTLQLSLAPVDFRGVVETAAQAMESTAAAKGITIDLDFASLAGYVLGDARRLKHVIMALLANAVHFTNSSGTVSVGLAPAPEGVALTVHDDGPAISPDALPYLFNRRVPKGDAATSTRGNLGVSLSLVRDVVTLHGGSIQVESDGAHGVTFTVVLPIERVPPGFSAERAELHD